MVRTKFGVVLLLGLCACGATSRSKRVPEGAGGSSAVGGALSEGGTSSPPRAGNAGEPAAGGGEGGAAEAPLEGYAWTTVPPLPVSAYEPVDPPPDVDLNVPPTLDTRVLAVSADGTLVLGVSSATYDHWSWSELFYWTEATGTQPLSLDDRGNFNAIDAVACLANDGSRGVISRRREPNPAQVYRFTPERGLQLLQVAPDVTSLELVGCDGAAQRASFGDVGAGAYWQLGANGDQIVSAPEGGTLTFARDAEPALLNVGSDQLSFSLWTPTQKTPLSGSQSCFGAFVSGDSKVIAGTCEEDVQQRNFRWTSNKLALLEPRTMLSHLSRNGNLLLGLHLPDFGAGEAEPELEPVVWLADSPMLALAGADGASWLGASDDGQFAYLQTSRTWVAHRFGVARGLEELPVLPELEGAVVNGFSADGTLAVGVNLLPGRDVGVAVLWDAQGVRDVPSELTQARVTPRPLAYSSAERVWRGTTIRVQGTGSDGTIWFAELPLR